MICEVHSTGAQASSLTAGSSKSGQKRADWRNFEKNYTSQTADEKPWADLRALPAGRLGEKAIYLSAAALELRVESKGAAQRREEKRASDGGANAAHQNHPLSSSWSTKLTLNEVNLDLVRVFMKSEVDWFSGSADISKNVVQDDDFWVQLGATMLCNAMTDEWPNQ
ncbi:hypothetical protein V9T40_001403 [Parthenolecanium corni]|uniref:Uncharacterized protein n=1 Tax=Parthenolecanium corni TaxID=536013 RepID=A0AAN9TCV1_9HEMI